MVIHIDTYISIYGILDMTGSAIGERMEGGCAGMSITDEVLVERTSGARASKAHAGASRARRKDTRNKKNREDETFYVLTP